MILALLACDPIGEATRAALSPEAPSHPRVWVHRRTADGWTRDPAPFARGFSSLHAAWWNGEWVVAGLPHAGEPSWWNEAFPRLAVGALVSRDLTAWEARSFSVEAEGASLIDPAIVEGPEGAELWFVQVEGGGDPGEGSRPVKVVRTRWNGEGFDRAEVVGTGRGLVDPAPVWFDGAWRVFLTRDHSAVVTLEGATILPGCSVPFARVEGGEIVLWAQRPVGGKRVAVESRSRDLRSWTPPVELTREGCASPSGGADAMFCVEER